MRICKKPTDSQFLWETENKKGQNKTWKKDLKDNDITILHISPCYETSIKIKGNKTTERFF